ncbi:MATE efflux family protein 6-like [Hibiscus syriacus]|uniref:MATE efflux family protein 6-like n=1 Tax=Hibiscus syriacus TaxID=106335 RepID=A0A6A3BV38_HIBSY|nr:alpha-1,3-arabinosyltransferase XAT2-like [Hibiscus syriacus]KAE8719751.1 MATE efflux family protein 6-like [Hibiscus syriacus]
MGEKITYDTFFARSFSRSDQRKLGYAAFLGCLLIALSFCLVFRPYSAAAPPSSVGLSNGVPTRMNIVCKSETRSDICEIHGEDIRIDAKFSTVFVSASSQEENSSVLIGPYCRKGDEIAMRRVKKWLVKPVVDANGIAIPGCNQSHNVPAILFSLGGYSGNNFHDFTDIIIPLYSTARVFNGEVKLLVTNSNPWWINKFRNLVQKLSNYEVIDIDNEANVHCFTTVVVGLKRAPQELSIDPLKSPYTMKDFRQFLRSAYSINKVTAIEIDDDNNVKTRPRLLIVARNRTRAFRNTDEIVRMASDLGYQVVVAEANGNIQRFAEIVNSCDVMMGVHGAGLTNMVFLPENAVLIQIIPIGGVEWPARVAFGEPSKDMNIRYLDYKIKTEESSLIQQYPVDHEVFNSPLSISKQGWLKFKEVYLDKQDVILDINRFKPTLQRALELLHR